jgi:hypothetical protein
MTVFILFTHPNFLDAATELQKDILLAGHAVVIRSHTPTVHQLKEIFDFNDGKRVLVHGHYEVEENYITERLPSGDVRVVPRAAFLASLSLA